MLLPDPTYPSKLLPALSCAKDPPTFSFGMDNARFGSDHNLLFLKHQTIDFTLGNENPRPLDYIFACARWTGLDTYQNAMVCASIVEDWERLGWICTWGCLDVIGVGSGTADALWNKSDRYKILVHPVNVSLKSTNPLRYYNTRAELAWNTRAKFRSFLVRAFSEMKAKEMGIAGGIPQFVLDNFVEQARSLKYKADERRGGAIIVQSKEEYKLEHDGKSPDEFDAVCMTVNNELIGVEKRPAPPQGAFAGILAR